MTTHIHTAIHARHDVLSLWCSAMQQMTYGGVVLHVHYSDSEPPCGDVRTAMPHVGIGAASYVVRARMGSVGVFVESDIIPVVKWSPDDYPGSLRVLEGSPGRGWFGMTIARSRGPHGLIPQRFVREGGCPDWLPAELCEPAMAANAKVVGAHFLHLDKMSRQNVAYADAKNKLLEILRQRFRTGLGDYVAAGLSAVGITPERVSKAFGVQDCGFKKRQAKRNELGRRPSGPGVELKALLKTIGITASPTCSCNKRAKIMDEKGCDWCEAHIEEIDGWLAEEAKKRKLPYLSLAGKTLIRLAVRRARKKDTKP